MFPRLDPPISTILYGIDGGETHFRAGLLHRCNGPAAILPDGSQYWFVDGVEITADVERAKLCVAAGCILPKGSGAYCPHHQGVLACVGNPDRKPPAATRVVKLARS